MNTGLANGADAVAGDNIVADADASGEVPIGWQERPLHAAQGIETESGIEALKK